ncbi:MAG: carboxypeptidase regulatory-like domain-containing protein, partial [Bacteroidia bacterium]|nr:carboxypeptidase regulatory-like domain-containing protein [Bacteroidia bacterium]
MEQFQKDSLDMFKRSQKYVKDTNLISSLRPGLVAANGKLKSVNDEIELKAGRQAQQIAGEALNKSSKREVLVEKLYLVTSETAGYAASIENVVLHEQMNYSITDLRKIGDESIVGTTNDLLGIVSPLFPNPALAGFGVDPAAVTDVETARDAYILVESSPELAEDETKAMTEALKPLFTKGRNILRNEMDNAAATLKPTQGDWWNEYHNARRIIRTGHRITSADGDVMETGTSTGIYNVEVTAVHEDGTTTVVRSDVNGHYKFIPLKFGVYTLTFKHT